MKTQIITALSIAAVLGAAGSAYAVNQSVLSSASSEETVIGSATPVLVPVQPKGSDIPDEYQQQLDKAAEAERAQISATAPASPSTSAPSTSSHDSYNDDDSDEAGDHEDESHDDESHEDGDDD